VVTRALGVFGGAGGWDLHDTELGVITTNVENDTAAVATARAAGLPTLQQDVRRITLESGHPFKVLKGGPPCQTFSAAGNGSGRAQLDTVLSVMGDLWRGVPLDYSHFHDVRTGLVLEPLRLIMAACEVLKPFRAVVLEQVPQVLPVWDEYAKHLSVLGYSVAVGKLHAEQYGVPQTRTRAVLIASLDRTAELPRPTHSKYHPHAPERLDPDVKPWISWGEALGPVPGDVMRSNYGTGGDPAARGERTMAQPAPTVTSKIDRNKWVFAGAGATSEQTAGQVPRATDQPAHTVTGKGTAAWVYRGSIGDRRTSHGTIRTGDQPAPTLTASLDNGNTRHAPSGERVTVQEAAVLQTFPLGYPWQGNKSQQYQQVGNAIPPLLAKAILEQVI